MIQQNKVDLLNERLEKIQTDIIEAKAEGVRLLRSKYVDAPVDCSLIDLFRSIQKISVDGEAVFNIRSVAHGWVIHGKRTTGAVATRLGLSSRIKTHVGNIRRNVQSAMKIKDFVTGGSGNVSRSIRTRLTISDFATGGIEC